MLRLPIAILSLTLLSACAADNSRGHLEEAIRALHRTDTTQVLARTAIALEAPDLDSRDRAKAYEIRGIAHLQDSETGTLRHGEAELARADLERAVELAPDVRAYRLMRAVAYYRTGEYDKAIADYDALIADSSTDGVGFIATRNRAAVLIAMGKTDAAIAQYTSWIAPSNFTRPTAQLGRCFAYATSNKLDEALSDCERVLRWRRWYGSLDARAYVQLKRARYAEAIADYDRVLEVRPDLVTSLYGRGLAKQGLGDSAGAKQDMDAAQLLAPDVAARMDKTRDWLQQWALPAYPRPAEAGIWW